jgi:dATP pyrophosphohydrolase
MPTLSAHAVDVYPYRRTDSGGTEWLVLRRAAGRSDAGRWRQVGGKIRPGEAAWEAALRELAEETGWRHGTGLLEAWALPSVNTFYEVAEDRVVLAPAFAARVEGEPTLDDEHDAWAWHPADRAASGLAWPEPARLLRLAARLADASSRPAAWRVPPRDLRTGRPLNTRISGET